jgi:hypothetical protein
MQICPFPFISALAVSALVAMTATAPAQEAPVELRIPALVALAEQPWLDRDAMGAALDLALGGVEIDRVRIGDEFRDVDPWFWSITGRFGTPRRDLFAPGGVVACSRYGVDLRDRLVGVSLSSPDGFRLLGATRAAHDDAEVWPEAAVARLSCTFTWDDTRRVSILPLELVMAGLAPTFDAIAVTGDAEAYGADWESYAPLYGADGYRVEARGAARDSVAWVERVLVELRVTHQRITFRAFLMGGGA